MMKAAAIAALSIPVFCAAAAGYDADFQAARQQADQMTGHLTRVADELETLGVKLPEAGTATSAPAASPNGDTRATAELGMFFDAAESRLVYLGNVHVVDPRVNLFAREQLHIYLQSFSDDKKDTPPPAPLADARETEETGTAVAEATAEPPPVTEEAEEPAAPAAESPAPETTAEEKPVRHASIEAHSIIADTIHNAIYVYSPADGGELTLDSGEDKVRITPGAGAPARILADPAGNILLEGGQVLLRTVNEEGGITELTTSGGHAYYHAATNTLHVPGKSRLVHPDGTLDCTEMLCVVLRPAADAEPAEKKGFMSQFTSLRFDGISTATARGRVVASGKAAGERPATRAEGDEMIYNGQTGECSLLGEKCRLVYGGYEVYANEGLHLLANGDIELRGSNIHGSYERESSQPGQMLVGTFKANAHVIFRAELGTITTAQGLSMADAEADFSCTGPAHLVLTRKADARTVEQKPGMPNLAITRFGDISRARATGNVVAHRYEAGTRRCIGELKAETVETDLTTGETLLTGAPGEPLVALYNGSHIEAVPAEGQTATMEMRANGDLKLNGDRISAILQGEKGTTTAKCRDYVLLVRAEDRLETGSATELHAPDGILTTNGSLHARLTTNGKPNTTGKRKFPGFSFNYNGISEATTSSGCTVRTEKGSMQCTGPVNLVMDTDGKPADKMMGGLKTATARGNVGVAGRDKTGRLFRATGDLLEVDAATGMKVLSGRKVTLGDANNTHIASGAGASIRIDRNNNVSIHGKQHATHATKLREQFEKNKSKNQPKK